MPPNFRLRLSQNHKSQFRTLNEISAASEHFVYGKYVSIEQANKQQEKRRKSNKNRNRANSWLELVWAQMMMKKKEKSIKPCSPIQISVHIGHSAYIIWVEERVSQRNSIRNGEQMELWEWEGESFNTILRQVNRTDSEKYLETREMLLVWLLFCLRSLRLFWYQTRFALFLFAAKHFSSSLHESKYLCKEEIERKYFVFVSTPTRIRSGKEKVATCRGTDIRGLTEGIYRRVLALGGKIVQCDKKESTKKASLIAISAITSSCSSFDEAEDFFLQSWQFSEKENRLNCSVYLIIISTLLHLTNSNKTISLLIKN